MAPIPTSTTTATERHVLVVLHEEIAGGATLSVLRLTGLLREHGFRFSFWAPSPSPLAERLRGEGHEVRGAPRHVAYSLRALRLPPGPRARLASLRPYLHAFAATVDELDPDLVHANSLTTLAEAAVARRRGKPVLFHVHEMVGAGPKAALTRLAARRIPTMTIAASAACAGALAGRGRAPEVVYESAPVPARPLRRERTADGRLTVATVGVVSRRKGSDLFVAAAERLRGEPIDFELVGSATDPLDAGWAQGVLARAARAGVTHTPYADVAARLADWDLFVLPSRQDPFPISVLEAMAAGLPVVAARTDGIAEQLTDGTGVLVEPGDPAALAAAILELAGSPARRAQLGDAARARVVANFTHEHQARRLASAYATTLARGGA